MSKIHPNAQVEKGAVIGDNVVIEAFAVVKGTVTLHDNVIIKSHAYIDGNTTIGENTVIWPGASIGTKAQDLKYRGEKTFVTIGKNCEIREYVTINSSCNEGSVVKVGDNCLIMISCHVAHNCEVGNGVIMANGSMLAGHVIVEDYAIIGGMTPIHQFCRIGCHSMVGGMSRISHDIPPYTIGGGVDYKFGGLNIIGLKRHNFSLEDRSYLSKAFKYTYRSNMYLKDAIEIIKKEMPQTKYIKHWVEFCETSQRGLMGLSGINKAPAEKLDDVAEEKS
jgi:UDP-N-acetylglucosamine acyltransferase